MFCLSFLSPIAYANESSIEAFKAKKKVEDIIFEDLERTDETWLREYLGVSFPSELSSEDLDFLRRKILTTGVFHRAELDFVRVKDKRYVRARIWEKWTTIPVVRAEVGGGTPLYVAGIYDQHSLGKLITLGGEARKYGDEKPGFVVWAKSPRHSAGKYSLGAEYWSEIRKRTFYDNDGNEEALFTDRGKRVRTYFYAPSPFSSSNSVSEKIGFDAEYKYRDSADLEIEENALASDLLFPEKGENVKASIAYVSDDIELDTYDYDGGRYILEIGASYSKDKLYRNSRAEGFLYKIISPFNLAAHFELLESQDKSASDLKFLGGFGSVRGYPDGIERGSHLYYLNLEARHIGIKYEKVQFQFNSFFDIGKAGYGFEELKGKPLKSAGIGIRIASPNIHRLMLRVDYGKSLDGKFSGISIGLNQFFQPYRPL